ncbi:MAG: hypothetical protein DRP03_02285 [Candidatus Aenigmatarchaeota archaeon]|nr:MAG: hypothetical protein DRP03_02285 [Candidatus Aenigmarchaeota archaeon]
MAFKIDEIHSRYYSWEKRIAAFLLMIIFYFVMLEILLYIVKNKLGYEYLIADVIIIVISVPFFIFLIDNYFWTGGE